jgi:GMP synthase (glutamine-hydrolysing)
MGHTLTASRLYRGEPLPSVDQFDGLILLGGPMSVNDESLYPWLAVEKELVRHAIHAERRVLGVCLGAQLIANALGARVYRNAHREIGWHTIERSPEAAGTLLGTLLPDRIEAFHWHGETFDLPDGAFRLAGSRACRYQAFAIGDRVLALQFHLEATPESVAALIEHCAEELTDEPFIQSPEEMMRDPARFGTIHAAMRALLERLFPRTLW